MSRPSAQIKVVHVRLDESIRPLRVDGEYAEVLIVASWGGSVLGQVIVSATDIVPIEAQWEAISARLGDSLLRERTRAAVSSMARGRSGPTGQTTPVDASVIVSVRDPDRLERCLASIAALTTSPRETLVAGASHDERTRHVCETHGARLIPLETGDVTAARNRGIAEAAAEVLALTDSDCVVDANWLDDLDVLFCDPLLMAVTGYVGPLEIETRAQRAFEAHEGLERRVERRRAAAPWLLPVETATLMGSGANLILGRRAVEESGLFAEQAGRTAAHRSGRDLQALYLAVRAGHRIAFDPARIVWRRGPVDEPALLQSVRSSAADRSAYVARCLVSHGETAALRPATRSCVRHVVDDLREVVRADGRSLPVAILLAETVGVFAGLWSGARGSRQRDRTAPAAPPARQADRGPSASVVRDADLSVSVVVTSCNRRERLRSVLEALAHQSYPLERLEVVVLLDGSTDGSGEMVRSLDVPYRLRLVEQPNSGLAISRNRGAREAQEAIVVFLDDDIVPTPDLVAEHAAAHARARAPHFALGYFPPVRTHDDLWALFIVAWWEDHFRRKAEPNHQWTFVDFVDGNSSFPRSLLFSNGGFDESFKGSRCHDWELGVRLLRDSVPMAFYAAAKGAHHLDTSFSSALRNRREQGRNDVLLASKHPHIRGQLGLAQLSSRHVHRSARAHVLFPSDGIDTSRRVLSLLNLLERLHLRREWARLSHLLLREAYVRGVREGVTTAEQLRALTAPVDVGENVTAASLELDRPSLTQLPLDPRVSHVAVTLGGSSTGPIRAVGAEQQWDWDLLADRVADELARTSPTRGAPSAALAGPTGE